MPASTTPPDKLLIATHNAGKLKEFGRMLGPTITRLTSAGEMNLPEPQEDGGTFINNALIKARAAAKASGWPTLADDSGLCIKALNGAPGVDTANWTKRGLEGLTELIDMMGDAPDRSAESVCVLALVWPDGREQVFEGRVPGRIVWPPCGDNGFGYDSIFQPVGESRTYAQMSGEEKSSLSHRRRAIDALLASWHR
jgi:XTP/dITP diphosphohydrolase